MMADGESKRTKKKGMKSYIPAKVEFKDIPVIPEPTCKSKTYPTSYQGSAIPLSSGPRNQWADVSCHFAHSWGQLLATADGGTDGYGKLEHFFIWLFIDR